MMRLLFTASAALLLTACSLIDPPKIPAEDLEVASQCKSIIDVLKNPKIRPNSREKYEAAKELAQRVDFSYLRNVKTIDQLFFAGDAHIDRPADRNHTIIFYYPYQNRSVRFTFHRVDNVVTASKVLVK